MTGNYEILYDEDMALSFINEVMYPLKQDEWFYGCLFARKKYAPELVKSNDRTQLNRFIVNKKEHIVPKVKRMEIPLGGWMLKDHEVPKEALVFYINPNPRDMKKAVRTLGKKCWSLTEGNGSSVVREAYSAVQQSRGTGSFLTIDVDGEGLKKDTLFGKMSDILDDSGIEKCHIIETRGGYHLLIDNKLITDSKVKSFIIKELKREGLADKVGDMLSPMPGTIQGGFPVRLIAY